ncbi:MAG: hypothetical protein ACI9F9_002621 [Candidatus Paceibacteria bacterium]|jgi:hypothetical protein
MERNLGEQPLAELLTQHNLRPQDLVEASSDQLTHKMVARATKGRRLTTNTMGKVLRAMNAASKQSYALEQLFNYSKRREE